MSSSSSSSISQHRTAKTRFSRTAHCMYCSSMRDCQWSAVDKEGASGHEHATRGEEVTIAFEKEGGCDIAGSRVMRTRRTVLKALATGHASKKLYGTT
jgi:hypothetical protein